MCPDLSFVFLFISLHCFLIFSSFFFPKKILEKEAEFLLFSDPEKNKSFIRFRLCTYMKCRYLSGIEKKKKKKHIPKHLWVYSVTASEEENVRWKKRHRKNIQSKIWNPGPPAIPHRGIEPFSLSASRSFGVAMTATMSAHRTTDALEVTVATGMASRDCEGQSEPINWTMLSDKKKTRYGSNHKFMLLVTFIPALPKMCVLRLLFFSSWFTIVWLFMQSLWWLCVVVYTMYREEEHDGLFLGHWLTLNNNVAVTLRSKSFKKGSNVNSI